MRYLFLLIFLAGCAADRRPAPAPEKPLPVKSAATARYDGACGCDCGSLSCLYGNCGKAGIPACCNKCNCIKHSTNVKEIQEKYNDIINNQYIHKSNGFVGPEEPSTSNASDLPPPGASLDRAAVEPRSWIPVDGHPGLFVYGRIDKSTNTIVDITHWMQR